MLLASLLGSPPNSRRAPFAIAFVVMIGIGLIGSSVARRAKEAGDLGTIWTVHATPAGPRLGLDTTVTFGPDGVGLTASVLHDVSGPVGRAAQTLTLRPLGAVRPPANTALPT